MKQMLLFLAPLFLFVIAFAPVQPVTVAGKITDDAGSPLSSVSVVEKGTKNGVSTNSNGEFKLIVSNENAVLVITSAGFENKEVRLKGKTTMNISLKPITQHFEEVEVTGYGVQKKMDATGSASTVNAKQIICLPYAELSYSLSGRAAGISISNAGSASAIRIRGAVSVYGNNSSGVNISNRGNGIYDSAKTESLNTEDYDNIVENQFLQSKDNPLSTFSIDVDAASYSNIRRFLNDGQLPPAGAVRIEEMVNYFKYEYAGPENNVPFAIHTELSQCPWNKQHKLALIGLQGRKISVENLPASNIVFLIDVSGSMMEENKLPLVKASMKLLVDQLREQDRVSMVVYAGAAGLVLPATSGANKSKIKEAIDQLEAGGSTAGGAGIKLAYKTARENILKEGNNRVILCTDGDFNIGISSDAEMERLIEEERKSGVFLTVLGYGMGNYKDNKMQKLADKGNGNHAYIDGISEAKKVLVNEFGGTLFTIAKDVKLQIEFNPAKVQGYRLIGYENRMLSKEDFNNDKKDAGELGNGHTVTALYEIIPVGVKSSLLENVDNLRYQNNEIVFTPVSFEDELMNIKLRYKAPEGDISKLIEHAVQDNGIKLDNTSDNFRFAAAVAEFGLLLRNSEYKSSASFDQVIALAKKAKGEDKEGYRKEFLKLVAEANLLAFNRSGDKDGDDEDVSVPVSKN